MNKTIPIICIVLFIAVITMVYFHSTIEPKEVISSADYSPVHGSEALERVFEACECQADPEKGCFMYLAVWQNSTHYIDNDLCKFITLDNAYQLGKSNQPNYEHP